MKGNTKRKKKLEKVNSKYLIIAVVVLSILVVGLSGYIFYDKCLREYLLYRDCEGCNPDSVPTTSLSPISDMERKLDIIIPVLDEELDSYYLYNDNWPYYAFIGFNNESSLSIAKDFDELNLREYLTITKEDIKSIEVSVYSDSSEMTKSKTAVWKYKDVYYAFTLEETSSLDFNKCVEDLIEQVIVNE